MVKMTLLRIDLYRMCLRLSFLILIFCFYVRCQKVTLFVLFPAQWQMQKWLSMYLLGKVCVSFTIFLESYVSHDTVQPSKKIFAVL